MLLTLPTFAFLNALAALVSSIFFLVSNILKICAILIFLNGASNGLSKISPIRLDK